MNKRNMSVFIFLSILFISVEMRASDEISQSDVRLAELKLVLDGSVANKTLKNQAVSYCQIMLEAKPIENVAKMAYSLDNAKSFLGKLQKLINSHCNKKDFGDVGVHFEKAKKNFLSSVVSPIREFLATMHEYKDFLCGLAKESLDGAGIKFEASMTCEFLQVNNGEASKFFETHVTGMRELALINKELIAFLGDFEASMPELFKKGRVRLEQIKKDKADKK